MLPNRRRGYPLLVFIFILIFTAACNRATNPTPVGKATETALHNPPASSPTPVPPTPTMEPAAAFVNGEVISLKAYSEELERYLTDQKALGKTPGGEEARQAVLTALIDRTLLVQAASKAGYQLPAAELQKRLETLATQMGGEQALAAWQTSHGYTPETFEESLKAEAIAAWERDQLAAQVPTTAEQVHVRQILVQDSQTAQKVVGQLNSGTKFATLALRYDPVTGGDLGWFPRGYLEDAQVEAAAFSLQPGQVSQVIQSEIGFHILEVVERDPQRPLNTDQRLVLQQKALQKWFDETKSMSAIQVLVQ